MRDDPDRITFEITARDGAARTGRLRLAGGTVETHEGFEELSMRNIMAVLAGGEAITPVNMQYLVTK